MLTKRPKPTTCRMFDTPLMEAMSHIPVASPFVFWVPVIGGAVVYAIYQGVLLWLLPLMIAGWLMWSIFEWTLHRYVFHYCGPSSWQRRFHFVAHGMHHDYPQDAQRLVMPLGISIPVGLLMFLGAASLAPLPEACAIWVGYASGYLAYDGIHYFTHHLPATSRVGKFLRRYHMVHHHTGVDALYGVSNPLWDYVFGTHSHPRLSRDA